MVVFVLNHSSSEVKDKFKRFVPKDFLKYTEDGEAILIGAVDVSDEGIEATGITILVNIDGSLIIKWIWMDPELRLQGGGTKMIEACYDIAASNDLTNLIAYVPDIEEPEEDESSIEDFLYDNEFIEVGYTESDGINVKVYSGSTDIYKNMENDLANKAIADRKLEKGYDKFPKRFVATDIEYFSGVSVEEE